MFFAVGSAALLVAALVILIVLLERTEDRLKEVEAEVRRLMEEEMSYEE